MTNENPGTSTPLSAAASPVSVPVVTGRILTLSMGAMLLLTEIFKAGWTSSPKEKIAAGHLVIKLEDYALTAPDPCALDPRSPDFRAAALAAAKAERDWKLKTATLEMTDLQIQAVTACVKFVANKEGGADRFVAELQEIFHVTE